MENTDFAAAGEPSALANQLLALQQSLNEYVSRANKKEREEGLIALLVSLTGKYGTEIILDILTDIHSYLEGKNSITATPISEEESFYGLRLQKIETYVRQHYSQQISLSEVASSIGMSPYALCRFYKRQTGSKLYEYITKVRMEHAIRLLDESGDTVSSIGYCCGYNTINYFIQVFREYTGMTPERWRVEKREGNINKDSMF